MDRRMFLAMMTAGGGLLHRAGHANQRCQQVSAVARACEVGIDSSRLNAVSARGGMQHASEWCWAACIEMIFRYYGHGIRQEEIVAATWGNVVNFPAYPQQILADLNRQWTDEEGNDFRVYGDVLSATQAAAAQDLAEDRPLILGSLGHVMVLTSMTYFFDQFGNGGVQSATVRDPWPGRGRRSLTPFEWGNANLLVRIQVEE